MCYYILLYRYVCVAARAYTFSARRLSSCFLSLTPRRGAPWVRFLPSTPRPSPPVARSLFAHGFSGQMDLRPLGKTLYHHRGVYTRSHKCTHNIRAFEYPIYWPGTINKSRPWYTLAHTCEPVQTIFIGGSVKARTLTNWILTRVLRRNLSVSIRVLNWCFRSTDSSILIFDRYFVVLVIFLFLSQSFYLIYGRFIGKLRRRFLLPQYKHYGYDVYTALELTLPCCWI